MIVPDINLLLYAEVTAFEEHQEARSWWERSINGEDGVGLCAPVIFGFIRISTNRRIFDEPMTAEQAIGRIERWLEQPSVRYLVPGSRHLSIAFELMRQLGTAANLTTDVQIASYAIEYGGEVHSNDTDFHRFTGLKHYNPLKT